MDDLAFIRIELKWVGDVEINNQYKQIGGKYYLMNINGIKINKHRGGIIHPVECATITTDIIHSFSKEDIQGVSVNRDDVLEEYAMQHEDTLFWKEHNALLPDSAVREAFLQYEQKRMNNEPTPKQQPFATTGKQAEKEDFKRPYVPNVSLMFSSDWTKDFSSFNYNSVSISHLVDYSFAKKFNRNIFVPLLASTAYYALSVPF